jgi:MarR family transcriptional regulator, lower aerobic nicotinate degradation pathway regulator
LESGMLARDTPHGPVRPLTQEHEITDTETDVPWMRALHADTGYLLYRLGLRSGQLFNSVLEEYGLRLRHYALLRCLATVEGALQRELSVRLGYDPSAIVSLVDDLQTLGFVERRPSPGDRRSRVVVLTDKGRDALRATDKASRRVTDDLLGPLDAEERAALHGLLLRVSDRDRG